MRRAEQGSASDVMCGSQANSDAKTQHTCAQLYLLRTWHAGMHTSDHMSHAIARQMLGGLQHGSVKNANLVRCEVAESVQRQHTQQADGAAFQPLRVAVPCCLHMLCSHALQLHSACAS